MTSAVKGVDSHHSLPPVAPLKLIFVCPLVRVNRSNSDPQAQISVMGSRADATKASRLQTFFQVANTKAIVANAGKPRIESLNGQILFSLSRRRKMNFLERWVKLSPDGGDGTVEAFLLFIAIIAIAIYVTKRLRSHLVKQPAWDVPRSCMVTEEHRVQPNSRDR